MQRVVLHPAPTCMGPRACGVVGCSFCSILQGVLQVAACHIPNHACRSILVVPLGACCPLERNTPLSLSHPFWIWSRVSVNMEPLRENQSDKPRLSVAQPRAPAARRAHATNDAVTCIGFCGSPPCHVDFEPSAAIEKSSKILLISYDKNWAPPLHRIFYQEHGFRCRGVF